MIYFNLMLLLLFMISFNLMLLLLFSGTRRIMEAGSEIDAGYVFHRFVRRRRRRTTSNGEVSRNILDSIGLGYTPSLKNPQPKIGKFGQKMAFFRYFSGQPSRFSQIRCKHFQKILTPPPYPKIIRRLSQVFDQAHVWVQTKLLQFFIMLRLMWSLWISGNYNWNVNRRDSLPTYLTFSSKLVLLNHIFNYVYS
jgi:hypothetical protein